MRIDYLEECVDLSETLSFTNTATRFFITQSVLSKHIAAIESELGIQIFERKHRGVSLTRIGEIFIEDARTVIDTYQTALEHIDDFKMNYRETIKIGFMPGFYGQFIPRIKQSLEAKHPGVNLQFFAFDPLPLFQHLSNKDLDIAFTCNIPVSPKAFDQDYECVPVFSECMSALMSNTHPLAQKEIILPEDLRNHTILLPDMSLFPSLLKKVNDVVFPEEYDISLIEGGYHDLDTLRLFLQDGRNIAIAQPHVINYFGGDRFVSRYIQGVYETIAYLIMWHKDSKKKSLATLAKTISSSLAEVSLH